MAVAWMAPGASSFAHEDDEWEGAGLAVEWSMPATEAAKLIQTASGYRPPDPGECGQLEVGPLLGAEDLSPRDFWLALISPHAKIVRLRERQDTRPDVIASLRYGESEMDFSVERASRRTLLEKGKIPFQFAFLPNDGQELRELQTEVGPIRGRMSINDALRIFIGSDDLMIHWMSDGLTAPHIFPSITPLYREQLYVDMSESACSFGYKELPRVTVTKSRLPSLQEDVASPFEVFDRERIEKSGAASLPELLKYATQTAFTRSSGYRLNGAQYAEGRGVGPAMVLIEGQRTMASAGSLQESAFDLNSIPLSAVDRIELIPDGASIVHGVDSVGGIVNIVLRRPTADLSSEARYGSARGGAIERRITALARSQSPSRDATLIADQLEVTNLPGYTRSRYANQNYSRYEGGVDRRSITSERGNLQSLDWENIPGLDSPMVGLPAADGRGSFEVGDLSEQPNLTSLLRYQSVAPARHRASLVAMGNLHFDNIDLSGNAIYTRHETEYTLPPPSVIGALVASDHPQNQLKQPLLYYGLLTGIPSQQFQTSQDLFRGSATLTARARDWVVELSLGHTQDRQSQVLTNQIDPVAVANSLNSDDAQTALNFFSRAPGFGRRDLLAPNLSEKFATKALYAHLLAERTFSLVPAGDIRMQIGADWRNEELDSNLVEGAPTRDAFGTFINLSIPVFQMLSLSAGARNDQYSDGNSVVSRQFGFEWRSSDFLKVHGDLGERYRPPSLFELHTAATAFDIPITDPKTGQTAIATVVQDGREDLRPTTAKSAGLGLSFATQKDLEFSIYYWQVTVKDRINPLSLLPTLQYEDYLPGRVIRGPSLIEGVPGPILTIDIGWENLGEAQASGVDFRMRKKLEAWGGRVTSELGVTWNRRYRYREMPEAVSPLSDRVGIASERGTILRHRAAAQFSWENSAWRIGATIIQHPSYSDLNALTPDRFSVRSQALVDLHISRRWGSSSLTVGAINAFDSEPGYANASALGYDHSQGDLRGRFLYGELRIGF